MEARSARCRCPPPASMPRKSGSRQCIFRQPSASSRSRGSPTNRNREPDRPPPIWRRGHRRSYEDTSYTQLTLLIQLSRLNSTVADHVLLANLLTQSVLRTSSLECYYRYHMPQFHP